MPTKPTSAALKNGQQSPELKLKKPKVTKKTRAASSPRNEVFGLWLCHSRVDSITSHGLPFCAFLLLEHLRLCFILSHHISQHVGTFASDIDIQDVEQNQNFQAECGHGELRSRRCVHLGPSSSASFVQNSTTTASNRDQEGNNVSLC